jgi:hypothetical protein
VGVIGERGSVRLCARLFWCACACAVCIRRFRAVTYIGLL